MSIFANGKRQRSKIAVPKLGKREKHMFPQNKKRNKSIRRIVDSQAEQFWEIYNLKKQRLSEIPTSTHSTGQDGRRKNQQKPNTKFINMNMWQIHKAYRVFSSWIPLGIH